MQRNQNKLSKEIKVKYCQSKNKLKHDMKTMKLNLKKLLEILQLWNFSTSIFKKFKIKLIQSLGIHF